MIDPLTILLTNKLNVQLKMFAKKIITTIIPPPNKHLSNTFIATKCTAIIN